MKLRHFIHPDYIHLSRGAYIALTGACGIAAWLVPAYSLVFGQIVVSLLFGGMLFWILRQQEALDTHSVTGQRSRSRLLRELDNVFRTNARAIAGFLFIDLDKFKEINDLDGHAVGDHVLRIVAETIRAQVYGGDSVGMLGGDEIGVLVKDVGNLENLRHLAERIREKVAALKIPMTSIDPETFPMTLSIGIIMLNNQNVQTAYEARKAADTAMREAKKKRNCVAAWHSEDNIEIILNGSH